AWPGPTNPSANAAAFRTEYPAESLSTGPAVTHGTRRSTRVAFSTADCASCSMNDTNSSRDWNLSAETVVDMETSWEVDSGQGRGDGLATLQRSVPEDHSLCRTSGGGSTSSLSTSGLARSQSRKTGSRTRPFWTASVTASGFSGIGTA